MIQVNDAIGIMAMFGALVILGTWYLTSRYYDEKERADKLEDALTESEKEVCRLEAENEKLAKKVAKMKEFANLIKLDLEKGNVK